MYHRLLYSKWPESWCQVVQVYYRAKCITNSFFLNSFAHLAHSMCHDSEPTAHQPRPFVNDFISALVPAFGAILNFDFSSSDAKQLSSPSIAGAQRKRPTTGCSKYLNVYACARQFFIIHAPQVSLPAKLPDIILLSGERGVWSPCSRIFLAYPLCGQTQRTVWVRNCCSSLPCDCLCGRGCDQLASTQTTLKLTSR